METNVYAVKGKVLIAGACLEDVWPEAVAELAREADQISALYADALYNARD